MLATKRQTILGKDVTVTKPIKSIHGIASTLASPDLKRWTP